MSHNNKQNVIIFGTGSAATKYVKRINKTHQIVCFMDNNKEKQGTCLNGVPILPPTDISKYPHLDVIVASEFFDEIYAQLKQNPLFQQTKIIYYRAMNNRTPKLEVAKLFIEKIFKDALCKTPKSLVPTIRFLLKAFSVNLVTIQSLDEAIDARELVLRTAQKDTSVGPNFIQGEQSSVDVNLPPVALYKFEHCFMSVTSRAFCVNDHCFIEKTHTISDKKTKYNKAHLLHHYQDKLALVRIDKKHTLPKGILINGYYDQNYYHWLIDIMPQLAYFKELPEAYDGVPILISNMSIKIPAINELLQLFNINREIIYLSHDNSYFVEQLFIISSANRCCPRILGAAWSEADYTYSRKESIHMLRDLVLKQVKSSEHSYPKKIFLAPSMKHRKYNQEDVFPALCKLGFVKVVPEKMSLMEQAKTFNHAEIIVGPTGASWTNLIFAQHNAKALCWMAQEWGNFSSFSNLAAIVGVELDYITYQAGVDDHVDLYSQEYVVDHLAILDWVKSKVNN